MGSTWLRLVQTGQAYSGIAIRDKKVLLRLDGSDPDELWRAIARKAAAANPEYFGFDGARARFLAIFPEGFASSEYLCRERNYKIDAKEKLDATVPLAEAREGSASPRKILAVFQATNLLSPFELMRVKDALYSENARAFIRGAARFAYDEIGEGLRDMVRALEPHDAAKWTIVTFLPFLWRPERHMFLKPVTTTNFAERVGHRFHHMYRPALEPEVYRSLLDLVQEAERELSGLAPRDRIDVQSFIWVVGNYDKADPEMAG